MSRLFGRVLVHPATTWAVLGLGLVMSMLMGLEADHLVKERMQDRFRLQSGELRNMLARRLDKYELALHSGAALFDASNSVDRKRWHDFVQALDIGKSLPGVQGLGFSQVIAPDELSGHVRAIRGEGFPQYRVHPVGERGLYTSIIYLEPFDWRNQRAFGFDMWSEPVRREAMARARDRGQSAVSGMVKLVQETEQDVQPGFLMYVPVYRGGAPTASVEQRRAALRGFVYSPFRVKDLMSSVFRGRVTGLAVELYDGVEVVPEHRFYVARFASPAATKMAADALEQRLPLDVAGHAWLMRIQALPDPTRALEAYLPGLLALGGSLASVLLFLYLRALSRTRQAAAALAETMTAELRASEAHNHALVECAPDAILVIDERGTIRQCNPACEHFFGYSGEELVGRNISLLMSEPQRSAHDGYLAHYLETGEAHVIGTGRDVEAKRKDGSLVTIHLRVGEQRLADGGIRFIGFIRDLSERVRAEAALAERKALLRNVIETSKDGFWVTDMGGRLMEVNDTYCRLSGYGRKELLAMNIQDVEANERPEETATHIENIMRDGSDLFETRHRRRDGQIWPVEISVTYSPEQGGRMIVFCRDISERKQNESTLKQALAESEDLYNKAATGYHSLGPDGTILRINDTELAWLGYRREELLALTWEHIAQGADYPEWLREHQRMLNGKSDGYWLERRFLRWNQAYS